MRPLFVSYAGRRGGNEAQGWVVLDWGQVDSARSVTDLVAHIEDDRRYDPGTLVLISFRRLEDAPSVSNGDRE